MLLRTKSSRDDTMKNDAIGVFDSGMGGLTAVKELNAILPHENIIYFGDTARIPYGSRSPETVLRYAKEDVAFLRQYAFGQACPLFVHLVENGYTDFHNPVTRLVAEEYLEPVRKAGVDTLILGCTHYPVIRDIIADYMGPDVQLISSGAEAAKYARRCLEEQDLLTDRQTAGENTYYVSDSTEMFIENAGHFLHRNVVGKVFRCNF